MKLSHSVHDVAAIANRSVRWVQVKAQEHGLGQIQHGRYTFTPPEVRRLRRLAKSDEKRGRS